MTLVSIYEFERIKPMSMIYSNLALTDSSCRIINLKLFSTKHKLNQIKKFNLKITSAMILYQNNF